MPNFIFLFRGDSPDRSPQEMQRVMQKWGAWIQELRQSGKFKGGDPLERSGKVLRGRKKALTDGPYAEAKDLVGGYVAIEAQDIDEAATLARGCPILDSDGSVEVRQIAVMEM